MDEIKRISITPEKIDEKPIANLPILSREVPSLVCQWSGWSESEPGPNRISIDILYHH
jgi:hypothetical protein